MIKNCERCGKSFTPNKYSKNPRYCSLLCRSFSNLGIKPLGKMSCEICGKEIVRSKFHGARFCSQACCGVYNSRTRKGVPRPEVAKPNLALRKRLNKECPQCHTIFEVKESHFERRRCCSKKCMADYYRATGSKSGVNNGAWKGGYSPYYGENWRGQRRAALKRDNHTCQRCHKTEQESGRELDVHHIVRFGDFGIERYREANHLSNLISLCNACHLVVEHAQGTRPNPR